MSSPFNTADAASYDSVAVSFDRLSERYTTPFAQHLAAVARIRDSDRVLDLAAGTGVVSRQALERHAQCVAIDLSSGMLRVASARAPALQLVRMDAEQPALQANSFDVVVSLFGMMHLPEPRLALAGCADMLKPGGTLAFAFGSPAPWPTALKQLPRIVNDYFKQNRGLLLKAPATLNDLLDAEFPRDESATETSLASRPRRATNRLVTLTKGAGFASVESGWIRKRFVIDTADAFWELQAVYSSRARKRLEMMAPAQVSNLREDFLEAAQHVQKRDGALVYDIAVTWVRATKPR